MLTYGDVLLAGIHRFTNSGGLCLPEVARSCLVENNPYTSSDPPRAAGPDSVTPSPPWEGLPQRQRLQSGAGPALPADPQPEEPPLPSSLSCQPAARRRYVVQWTCVKEEATSQICSHETRENCTSHIVSSAELAVGDGGGISQGSKEPKLRR